MNWKEFWESYAKNQDNPHVQVGRTVSNQAISADILPYIQQDILDKLSLQPTDRLLDICCGNGMLTHHLAQHCAEVTAIDLSEAQISYANTHYAHPHIQYIAADVLQYPFDTLAKYDKILLYFSFQYFDTYEKGQYIISQLLNKLEKGGILLIGDVPDIAKLDRYCTTWTSRIRFYMQTYLGNNPMGKFWSHAEMRKIAHACGARLSIHSQPSILPYAHYRCDYILYL
jgi:cyclopropane fatty-acyl-phospholipid synthase-like methyltransferase